MAVRADEILHKGYHASRNIVMFTLKPRNAADYRFAGVVLSEAKNPVRDRNISKANDSAVRLNICRRTAVRIGAHQLPDQVIRRIGFSYRPVGQAHVERRFQPRQQLDPLEAAQPQVSVQMCLSRERRQRPFAPQFHQEFANHFEHSLSDVCSFELNAGSGHGQSGPMKYCTEAITPPATLSCTAAGTLGF